VTNHVDADDQALTWLDEDRLHEECGVFGIFGHPDAAALTALGLHALQHRGQEAAGIVSFDGAHFHTERRLGLVGDHFTASQVIERLKVSQRRPALSPTHPPMPLRRRRPRLRPISARKGRILLDLSRKRVRRKGLKRSSGRLSKGGEDARDRTR